MWIQLRKDAKYSLNLVSLGTLIAAGIISSIIWYLEVDFNGWTGLRWIGYFHFAFPISGMIFLIWLFFANLTLPLIQRIVFLLLAAVTMVAIYFLTTLILPFRFYTGPSSFFFFILHSPHTIFILQNLSLLLPFVIPLITFCVTRLVNRKVRIFYFILSMGFIILSIPLSVLMLMAFGRIFYGFHFPPDFLHTIKTGIIIPFIMFSIGFPYLFTYDQKKPGRFSSFYS